MKDLFEKFLQVLEAFGKEEVDYVLVGGFAVILHGMPRLTQDIDVFVKMNPENIGRLQKALHRVFPDDASIDEITIDELNRYSVIRYGSPGGFYIDIMSRLGEVATYDDLEYETIIVNEISIKVATAEKLFELKKDTLRLEDKRDAFFLSELMRKKRKEENGN